METITITLITIIMAFFASPKTIINRYLTLGMCTVSSYYFLNFKFDNSIILWLTDSQWTKNGINELFSNGIAFWWVIFMGLSYSIFYILLPILVGFIPQKLVFKYIEKKITQLGDNAESYKRVVSFISKRNITKIIGKEAIGSLTISERDKYSENLNNIVCYLSHFLCCWILLSINNSWQAITTIILTTIIVIILNILFYPLTDIFNFPYKKP